MKLLKYFIGMIFISVLGGGLLLKNYLSSPDIQQIIRHELMSALAEVGIHDPDVDVGAVGWGGLSHPFSMIINQATIKDSQHKAELTDLILGVSALKLLMGTHQLKHVAAHQFSIKNDARNIVSGEFEVLLDLPRIALKVNKVEMVLNHLADLHPIFNPVRGIECPASFMIIADYDGKEVTRGAIKGTLASGEILLPPYYLQKTPIKQAKFEINLTPSKIKLAQLTLETNEAFAQLSGTLRGHSILTDLKLGREVNLTLQGNLDRLPVDLINTYWPHGLANDAREWVTTNLSKGEASNATIQMKATLKGGDNPDFTIKELSGDIDATGVDVAYLGNLPKVINTSGHCRYSKTNFIIDAHGTCDGMTVKDAHLDISQLDQENGHMDIDLKVEGGVKPALNLISQQPLELTQKLGLDPKLFDGQAETHLKLSFPLGDDSGIETVKVDSVSAIKDASMMQMKLGKIMTAGEFDLKATNDRLDLKGTALVSNHPSEITAYKSFINNDRSLVIRGKDTRHDPQLGEFFISFKDGKLLGRADLSKVAYDIPMALFMKEEKDPGGLDFTGSYNDDGIVLDAWNLKFGSGMAQGTAQLNLSQEQEIFVKSMQVGEIQGSGTVTIKDKYVQVKGEIQTIDLDHVYHHHGADEDETSSYTVDANLKINQLKLSHKLSFGAANLRVTQLKGELTSLKLESEKPGVLEVFVTPEKNEQKHITLSCHNAGDILDYFMPNSDFEGGILNVVGQLSGKVGARAFKAEIDLRDFVAVKAPVLAQILSLSSLDGIMRTLTGQGVSFSNTVGHLEWEGDLLTLKDIHASGSSIALTLDGTANLLTDNISIDGELYPINSLNVMLAHIPLVGQVLGGEKNRGVFATAFKLTGKRQDPVISANPLSTIAPQSVKELYKQQVMPGIQNK